MNEIRLCEKCGSVMVSFTGGWKCLNLNCNKDITITYATANSNDKRIEQYCPYCGKKSRESEVE